jgi:Protein of unknown function (DUF4058)
MPSPFPGMDPYLEGYLWADVHQALAYQCRRQLVPLVAPRYAVRLAVTMVTDRVPAHEIGIILPDVEIIRPHRPTEPAVVAMPAAVAIPPAPASMPLDVLVPTRLVTVEVHDIAQNTLVTSIEIMSPANKREPGLQAFMSKRDALRLAGVHILEIDLLRRGQRPWPDTRGEAAPYMAALVRAGHLQVELWPIDFRDPLPLLPVPLRPPDPDVPLDVQQALDTIYDEAQYGLTLNYDGPPPPPPLSAQDMGWLESCVRSSRQGE